MDTESAGEEAPQRPLPCTKEPTFSLTPLLCVRSQPRGANLRMGRDRGFRSSLLPGSAARRPSQASAPAFAVAVRIESSRSPREAHPQPLSRSLLAGGKPTRFPIGYKGRSSKAGPASPSSLLLATRPWPKSPDRATLAACHLGAVAFPRPFTLLG